MNVSIHDAKNILARASGTMGAPLTLNIQCGEPREHRRAEVTIFTGDYDLSRRLKDAINFVNGGGCIDSLRVQLQKLQDDASENDEDDGYNASPAAAREHIRDIARSE